jgi:hypothetical protein
LDLPFISPPINPPEIFAPPIRVNSRGLIRLQKRKMKQKAMSALLFGGETTGIGSGTGTRMKEAEVNLCITQPEVRYTRSKKGKDEKRAHLRGAPIRTLILSKFSFA